MPIERKEYMKRLQAWKDKQVIKVITGVRRCGKSVLLEMYQEWLHRQGVPARRIVSINLEDMDNKPLREPEALHAHIVKHLSRKAMTYVFIDEIQMCENFPDVVNSLHTRPFVDIYITGSNANLLSHEIATLLSGRYVEIKMLPLSFKEFAQVRHDQGNLQHIYTEYVTTSSFPYSLNILETRR